MQTSQANSIVKAIASGNHAGSIHNTLSLLKETLVSSPFALTKNATLISAFLIRNLSSCYSSASTSKGQNSSASSSSGQSSVDDVVIGENENDDNCEISPPPQQDNNSYMYPKDEDEINAVTSLAAECVALIPVCIRDPNAMLSLQHSLINCIFVLIEELDDQSKGSRFNQSNQSALRSTLDPKYASSGSKISTALGNFRKWDGNKINKSKHDDAFSMISIDSSSFFSPMLSQWLAIPDNNPKRLVSSINGFFTAVCRCIDIMDKKISTGYQVSRFIAVGEMMRLMDAFTLHTPLMKRIYQSSFYQELMNCLLDLIKSIATRSPSSIVRYGWTINSVINRIWKGPNDDDDDYDRNEKASKGKGNGKDKSTSKSGSQGQEKDGKSKKENNPFNNLYQRKHIHVVSEALVYSVGRSVGVEIVQAIAERAYFDLQTYVFLLADQNIMSSQRIDSKPRKDAISDQVLSAIEEREGGEKQNNKRGRDESAKNDEDNSYAKANEGYKSKKAKINNPNQSKGVDDKTISEIAVEFLATCICTIRASVQIYGHLMHAKLRHAIETTLISYLQGVLVGGSYICKSYQIASNDSKIEALRRIMSIESEFGESLLCESLKTLFSCLSTPVSGNNESVNLSNGLKIFESGFHNHKSPRVVEVCSMALNALGMIVRPRMMQSSNLVDIDDDSNLLYSIGLGSQNEIERYTPHEEDLQSELLEKEEPKITSTLKEPTANKSKKPQEIQAASVSSNPGKDKAEKEEGDEDEDRMSESGDIKVTQPMASTQTKNVPATVNLDDEEDESDDNDSDNSDAIPDII